MGDTVDRDAMLFEAGEYPERNLEFTERDLDGIVEGFREELPVNVEHTGSPLRLGVVTQVWRDGRRLLGRLRLSANAWALLQESGAKALSVGLQRVADGWRLFEVSVVGKPRVADARIFGVAHAAPEVQQFSVEFDVGAAPVAVVDDVAGPDPENRGSKLDAEVFSKSDVEAMVEAAKAALSASYAEKLEAVQASFSKRLAEAQVDAMVAGGRIATEQRASAVVLLSADADVAAAFSAFVEAAPVASAQPQPAAAPQVDSGGSGFDDAERAMLRALGCPEDMAAAAMAAGR